MATTSSVHADAVRSALPVALCTAELVDVQLTHVKMSVAEYLALDHGADVKHEYVDGAAHTMAGGTIEHGAIARNSASRDRASREACQILTSDVRVATTTTLTCAYDMRIFRGMRKSLNVTVSEELVARAKALGINVSRAAEEGIENAVRAHRKPGFLKGQVQPVPPSFFDPLPADELGRWQG